jgi:hypothetical protein
MSGQFTRLMARSPLAVLVPRTDSWTLRLAVLSVCVLFLCLGISHLWAVYGGNRGWMSLILSVVFIGTGVCLWMLKAWARKLTLIILGLIVVVVPLGMASPVAFLEFWSYHDGNLPLWLVAVATIFLFATPIFWCMYVLGKYKEMFR